MLTTKLKAIPLGILNDHSLQPLERRTKGYSQGVIIWMKINHFFNASVLTNKDPQPYSVMLYKGNQVIHQVRPPTKYYMDSLWTTTWKLHLLHIRRDNTDKL